MSCAGLILGFGLPGYPELVLILILGLLLFGRNLPQVGKQVARTIMEFKRGLRDLRDQIDRDEDLRDVRATLTDVQKEVKSASDLTRLPDLSRDPKQIFDNLTDPDLASPGPESEIMPPVPENGPFEQAALELRVERTEPPVGVPRDHMSPGPPAPPEDPTSS